MNSTDASSVTHRLDNEGILWLVFDTPGQRVNLLNAATLEGLGRLLEGARSRGDLRGVVLTSAKPGMFIAGMDVDQIAGVTDSHQGAESARYGQAVFQKIAELKVPTVAAIGGACMGGGTEMALACDFRIAADDPDLRIGLPEVQLGIIPGFGGSQRLPRLVGLVEALKIIVGGSRLDGTRARRIGLVDRVVPAAYLDREARKLARRAAEEGIPSLSAKIRRRPTLIRTAQDGFGPLRRLLLDQTRKRAAAKANPRDYPAPSRAIEAIEAALTRPLPQGLDMEARILGELIPTRTSKNLIWLFQSRNALRKPGAGVTAAPRPVRRIAVLGAGIMGGGIAQLAAHNDIPVRLRDLRYDAILSALETAAGVWHKQVGRKRMSKREAGQRMAFIAPTLDATGLSGVDLAIEAVVENLQVKQQVLAEFEQHAGDRAVFATNTSSLPIGDIAARALHPERVVGMHFFNPVHRMPLVEVIAGRDSSPEAVATVHALAIRLGKVPVVVKDGPGFLVNRILNFYIQEAARLFQEGVRIEDADAAMTAFGMPMGPFKLLDQVGLDTARHVGEVLRGALGKRAGEDGTLLEALVASGRLGQKNGKGFYRYRNGKPTSPDPDVYGLGGSPPPRDVPPETLQERMVLSMVNEAVICLEEGVVAEPREVDMALVMGTGFPPFRGGLLRHADQVGIPIIADRLSRLADAHGQRFQPAGLLQSMVREQRRFYRR